MWGFSMILKGVGLLANFQFAIVASLKTVGATELDLSEFCLTDLMLYLFVANINYITCVFQLA